MKKIITFLFSSLAVSVAVQAQQIQGDFDAAWEKCYPDGKTEVGIQPKGWAASNVYQILKFKDLVVKDADRKGNAEGFSAKLTNKYCGALGMGSNAPAYITLGKTWVFGDLNNLNKPNDASDGGSYGGIDFTFRPDSLIGWIKRKHGTEKVEEVGKVVAYLWKGTSFSTTKVGLGGTAKDVVLENRDKDILGIDVEGREITGDAQLIANAEYTIEGDIAEWTRISIPLNYVLEDGVSPEKTNVVISSADYFNRKNIGKENILWTDDFKYVYNSRLSAININGVALEGFNKDIYVYKFSELPKENDIVAVPDGKGAKVNIQKSGDVIRIIVTGNDSNANQHIYSLIKEDAAFGATSINLNEVKIKGFSSTVYSYENLAMVNGNFPTVSVSADPVLTDVDMQLDEAKHTIKVVVTDKVNQKDHTYTLVFTPSEKIMNGSQIKGDFEVQTPWGPEGGVRWGTVADGWSSSNVLQLGFLKFVMVEKEERAADNLAVKMVNGRPGLGDIASNAPGYISLGNPWVYADMTGLFSVQPGYTGTPDTDDSDGGTIGGVNFTYQPDSIVGYYKRAYADPASELKGMNPNEEAKIHAYLWKGTSTSMAPATSGFDVTGSTMQLLIDRDIDILGKNGKETPDGVTLIASAEETVNGVADWARISVPLNYVSNEKPEKANVVISSADYFNRPNIGNGNSLSADDVVFIYNSKLASLTVNGEALNGFNKDTYIYKLAELPSEDDIVAVADGKGATVTIQANDNVIKIIVVGNDGGSNQHTYLLLKEGAVFNANSISINEVGLDGFESTVYSYKNLAMVNGNYPVVSVSADPVLTDVDMQLNDNKHTISIVVSDKINAKDHIYTLEFTPSEKIMNGPQLKGDFEVQTPWGPEGMDRWGTVADGWSSSNVLQLGFLKFVMVEKEERAADNLAVKMINGRPGMGDIASNAPGYVTLGNPWVYADMIGLFSVQPGYSGLPDSDDSDGGTIGGVNFTYQPDSIVGYYKRAYADPASELKGMNPNEEAKILAYLWRGVSASMAPATSGFDVTGSTMQLLIDREIDILGKNGKETPEGVTLVASAEETVNGLADWTRISVPLNYVSHEKPEKANVIISSADYFNRPNIGNGNSLSADNVAFIYNSKLESITIDGEPVEGFDKNTYSYSMSGALPEVISTEADGKGAIVEITQNSKVVTVRVKGNDFAENPSNVHTYTFNYGGVGIEQNSASIKVSGKECGIIVEGVQDGRVEVYSIQGILVGQYMADNNVLTVDGLMPNTVYIVKYGSHVVRVLTK